MALHTELDIYKVGYQLLGKVTNLVKNMQRDFKRLIGEEIVRESAKVLILVYRANIASNKAPHLLELIERVQMIEVLLRLSMDMEKISPAQYAEVVKLTRSIGKQATGWRKSASRPHHGGQGHHD
ncbi:four helix bundle protein [Burkholderia multivorans]|uniref:four helix bundle protein n=1 Tax=Burkholderia multivorans TaxID=87883 RepID=UPI000CFEEB25|nr:four helix bundle protein [Burkholderia multivorans]PRF55365.1 four helix bundle protein [Burkholderia multivorans]